MFVLKKKYTYLVVIFLIVASCAAFGRILGNDFINFDDNKYITENYHVQSGINQESIKWAFTTTYFYWHPLTWLSHTLDWSLFGANASGHHLVSMLLHIGAVIFLFLFLYKTTNNLWPAAFAAAFFAIHPLRVESVAWAAERKDILSMFFGMACLYAYAFYAELPKLSKYILCLILFIFSLMSKPMMVTMPFVLMLLDYWPLKRWQKSMAGRIIWEKVPFLLLTIASSILTFWAQNKGGAVASETILPLITRVDNAVVSYVAYLERTFWPFNLAVFYPYEFSLPLWKVLISAIIIIVITLAVLYYIRKLPFLFVGWFWYLGTLVPLIGLIQAGMQAMADRHTYLPSIGIAIMLAWVLSLLFQSENTRKKILFPAEIASLAILSVLTWQQCSFWKNSITLFSHALQVTKDNYLAHNNRGTAYIGIGQYQRAIDDYNEGIRLNPGYAPAYNNRGNAYIGIGQYQRGIDDYNEAILRKTDFADAYNNRGVAYARLGQYQRVIEEFNKAIHLNPDHVDAYKNRGIAYFMQGNNKLGCLDVQKNCAMGGNCKLLEDAKRMGVCR
ncbi:MAG: tetratricopeptide repeat protein [Bacteroidia bacterium]|nr:tetratricopeptide repeat protein [Bacteroidia bacterium]